MQKDRRTDNWGGYHDYNRDPRQYHFPHSTKEIGWGDYHPQVGKETNINWWMIIFFAIVFLLIISATTGVV